MRLLALARYHSMLKRLLSQPEFIIFAFAEVIAGINSPDSQDTTVMIVEWSVLYTPRRRRRRDAPCADMCTIPSVMGHTTYTTDMYTGVRSINSPTTGDGNGSKHQITSDIPSLQYTQPDVYKQSNKIMQIGIFKTNICRHGNGFLHYYICWWKIIILWGCSSGEQMSQITIQNVSFWMGAVNKS